MGTEGYHTLSISDHNEEDQDLYPVEFNFDHLCWVEICWNQEGHWEAFRAAGTDLGCDIPITETRLGEYRDEEHQSTPQTQHQSEDNSEPEEIDVQAPVNPAEEESLAHLVASIPLPSQEPMATQTLSSTIRRSHVRAFLSGGSGGNPGPSNVGGNCPLRGRQPGGPFIGGGMPGGGGGPPGDAGEPPGGSGGPPGGGDPGANEGPLNIPRPSDRFIGKEPQVFTGDRTKADEFFTQWNLFVGVNFNNPAMTNAFSRAMLFLTYICKDHTLTNGSYRSTDGS